MIGGAEHAQCRPILVASSFPRVGHCYLSIVNKRDRQCTDNVTLRGGSYNRCCSGKAISITYSECVSITLSIKDEMRVRHIVVCGVSRCLLQQDEEEDQK